MLNVETLNEEEYQLTCDGEQIATIKRAPWDVGGGVQLRVGTTKEGYTVAAMTLDTLVIALVAKRVETGFGGERPAEGASEARPVRSQSVRRAVGG